MRKTIEECRLKLLHRTREARLKIIFDWIKNDEIAFHLFEELLELHQELEKHDLTD